MYFFPLSLKIDPVEKATFINTVLPGLRKKYFKSGTALVNVKTVTEQFPNTIAQTNKFVESIGLKTRAVTLFVSDENATSYAIHADGVYYNKVPTLLEARLSYYELAEAPGIIKWWDSSEMPITLREYPATEYSQARVNVMADCVEDLQAGRIQWHDLPASVFEAETNVPSAILRTNEPHTVIQGNGLRITISCQLVFSNGNPAGVWEHIKQNFGV